MCLFDLPIWAGTNSTISYGSMYFASNTVDGAVPAQIISDAPPQLKNQVSKTFTIGPTVDRDFWTKEHKPLNTSNSRISDIYHSIIPRKSGFRSDKSLP